MHATLTIAKRITTELVSIADRINAAHVAFEAGMKSSLALAVEAGELLLEVKEGLPHGGWLPWLRDNFSGSQQTASRYMTVARGFPQLEANYARASNLSLRSVVKMLAKDNNASGLVAEEEDSDESDELNSDAAVVDSKPESASVTDLHDLIVSGTKFGCIYADPPWKYGNQATRASTDNHYPTMTVDDIAALPIGELAADKSHLWLWTTNGFLFECPKIFAAWGFEFKSSYVWCKTQMGIGNYLRNAHEFLLLGVRGGLTGAAKNVRSWGEFPRAKHSAKPEQIRDNVIERLSPGPRLELFGRSEVAGWTVWGNQVRPIEKGIFDGNP